MKSVHARALTKLSASHVRQHLQLVTIAVQCFLNRCFNRLVDNSRTSQISLPLLAHPSRQMAGARLPVHRLPFRG